MVHAAERMVLQSQASNEIPIKGIVFDMDGTLTKPQSYMFREMREALGIVDKPVDILKYIEDLPADEQAEAERKVQAVEHNAMVRMQPTDGLQELFNFLNDDTSVKFTICTRNLITPVNYLLDNYLPGVQLHEPIVTRSFTPPKPSPKPLLHISEQWDVEPKNMIMVGDSRDDMFSGMQAGCSLVLMRHQDNAHLVEEIPDIDYVIEDFYELKQLLHDGFEKRPKEPREMSNFVGY